MEIVCIVLVLLNALDYIFTMDLVNKFGIMVEYNPIGRWILANKLRALIFKMFVPTAGAIVLCIFRDIIWVQIAIWVLLAVYVFIFIDHLLIKKFLKEDEKWNDK